MPGMDYRMAQVNDNAGVALMAGETGHPTFYFDTDDIDASIATVRELGGTADDKSPVPTHGWFAACSDSEGNVFSCGSRTPPPADRRPASYIPSRSTIFGSRRHFARTLTTSSRKTGCPTSRSTSGRAREPISRTIAPFLPTRMPFCDSVSTSRTARTTFSSDLLDDDHDRVRHLVARQVERLLADHLGDPVLGRQVGGLVEREVERPFGQQVDEVVAQLPHAVLRHRADRVERVEVAERRGRLHLRRDVAVLEAVDLVDAR